MAIGTEPRTADRAPVFWSLGTALIGAATALLITRHAWGPRLIGGGDITADLVRSDFGIAHLVAHGRLDGWFPRFMLGHREFVFNGPGLTWTMAAVRTLTLGALSNAGAAKVMGIGALCLQPLAVAYFARSFGLDRFAAMLAGILSLTATTRFGLGVQGLFQTGLLSHQVGALAFFVCFGAMLRLFDEPSLRRMIVPAVSAAALAITHIVSVAVLMIMLPLALAFRFDREKRQQWLRQVGACVVAIVGAVALAGFWVVPFVAHRDLRGPNTAWATDPFGTRLNLILHGKLLFEPIIAALVVLSWIGAIVWAVFGRRDLIPFIAVPLLYLFIAHASLHVLGGNAITLHLANRGLGYAGVIALMPLAALVSAGVQHVASTSSRKRILVAAIIVVTVALTVTHARDQLAREQAAPTPAFVDAASQLRKRVPPGARFSLVRDAEQEQLDSNGFPDPAAGVSEPDHWLAWASGVDSLNPFNPESSNAGSVAYTAHGPAAKQGTDEWVRALRRLGVIDVVVATASVDAQLARSALVQRVWSEAPVAIYEIRGDAVLLETSASNADVQFTARAADDLKWSVDTAEQTNATLAIAWSPQWHATLDGRNVAITETSDGLIQISIPGGAHTLRLVYRSDFADDAGVALSIATVLLVIAVAIRRRRSASHTVV